MNENPWCDLPVSEPFVLPSDREQVSKFNERVGPGSDRSLQLDILPEPFVGARDAPVVLLSNNPGVGKGADHRRNQVFRDRMRKNLIHRPSDYPFVYLDPKLNEAGKWWHRKLKNLLEEFGGEVVARSILNVVFFPYPSRKYGRGQPALPSQAYSFRLVREAVERK